MKIEKIDICKKTDELRKLILENPDLPIVVLTSNEVVADDTYGYWYGCDIAFNITSIICVDDRYYEDIEEFKEYISDCLECEDYAEEFNDEEFNAEVERIAKDNERLWTKCIAIYSDV